MNFIREFRIEEKEICLNILNYFESNSVNIASKTRIFEAWKNFFYDFYEKELPLTDTTVMESSYGESLSWEEILLNYLKAFQSVKNSI